MRYTYLLCLLLVATLACSPSGQTGPQVLATTYHLSFFTQQIAGDTGAVATLVPMGVEPHDWEPTPRDIVRIESSTVFVFNGAGLEPWAEQVAARLTGSRPIVVDASQGLELLPLPEGKEADGEHEQLDPHVWLDPILAQFQARAIAEALAGADPNNTPRYAENYQRLAQRLNTLDQEYRTGLAQCRLRSFFAAHAAFGYVAKRYNLQQIALAGLAPDATPSPARLAALSRLAREQGVKYIFFETLVSPALSQTLAREVGAQTMVLNPIEGLTEDEAKAGKDYFALMGENLKNLRQALECR